MVKPLNGLQVRSILDHDEELEALLSRVAASRRLVIDVDPAEKTRSDGQALVAVTIALTTNFACRAGQGVAVPLKIYAYCIDAMPPPPTSASPTRSAPKTPSQTRVTRVMATPSMPPEMPGQGRDSGGSGQRNRYLRPRATCSRTAGADFAGEAFEHVRVVAGQDEDADAVFEGHLGQCFRCLLVREDV